ncbi:protein DpdD [Rhodococcus ruber]|uniref:protein DpdD n=1 Tax=Rhodococcus ruber TaxID=1830 RepID=UPI0024793673|nr:protein DpdD [Rhodococcus ruber]
MTQPDSEQFLSGFFSPPNTVWPNRDQQHPVTASLAPFLEALTTRNECPVVLPRRERSWPAAVYYVICWDTGHAGRVRPLIEAAVAHNWCPFDGRVTQLDHRDPIEARILDLVGPGTTFLLRPTPGTARRAYDAMKRMITSLRGQPLRIPTGARPVGRMLREFELALVNGSAETSATLLSEIEAFGGISHENVAYLQIRRLVRLGQDRTVLEHGALPTIVYSDPPSMVREAILGSWARVSLQLPLTNANATDAIDAIRNAQPDIAMLVDDGLAKTSDRDVATVGVLVAVARGDSALARVLAASARIDPAVLSALLPDAALSSPTEGTAAIETECDATAAHVDIVTPSTQLEIDRQSLGVDSWLAWVRGLETTPSPEPAFEYSQNWAPAWVVDAELADAVDDLPQIATDGLLSGVAAFLESDDLNHPAMNTAAALLRHYMVAERFSPNDLGAICALLEIFLRGSPSKDTYSDMLSDLRSYAPQWVAASAAPRVLDIADVVASGPNTDPEERKTFVAALIAPLHHLRHRLSPALRRLASLIANDVGLRLAWTDEKSKVVEESGSPTQRIHILLYSLDTGCLARVRKAADLQWPSGRVHVSSDKVGNSALRQHARNAELIVIATRRAAHAATGFITENAGKGLIRYADGSGSASMMRAVEDGITELLT